MRYGLAAGALADRPTRDGLVDRRTTDSEEVAQLSNAEVAGPVQDDQVGFLADVQMPDPLAVPPAGITAGRSGCGTSG
jgi:hypothetical protein